MKKTLSIHEKIAKDAKLGNTVYCHKCGKQKTVNPAECLAKGWPKCCTLTMSLDHRAVR